MKKILFAGAFALLGAVNANAQTQQGNWMVGSSIMDVKFTNGFGINLNPKAAYFIQDRWAVGAGVGLNIQKVSGVSETQTNWEIAPFTRYYFTDNQVDGGLRNGSFFAEGSVGFGGVNSSSGSTTNGVSLGIGAGYAYFITSNVSVEGLLKFGTITGGGNTNGNGNLNLGVGFNIYLPTSKVKAALKDQQ